MGNCAARNSDVSLEKLETDILMISTDTRRQMDQLVREMIIIKQAMKRQNLDNTRRYTMCCPTPIPAEHMNKVEYI